MRKKTEPKHESIINDQMLQPDSQYRQDLEDAHRVYGDRMQRGNHLPLRVTVGEFTNVLLSDKEPTPGVTLYEKLAGQEIHAAQRLAAVRLALRQIDSRFASS